MRSFNVMLICCIGLLVGAATLVSCGSGGDLLDETGQRYTASITIKDNKVETLSVDVIQDYCDTTPEDFFPVSAAVEFSVDANASGITLESYTLEYIPLPSEDGVNGIVMPPTLDGPLFGGNLGIDIESNETADFEITCMSVDTKEEYRKKVGWVYYEEDPLGQAAIDAKKIEIANKEAQIQATRDAIVAADAAGLPIDGLQVQLAAQEDELADLQTELNEMYFAFWATPDLQEGRYKIRITFNFVDKAGEQRTVVRERTVWLGNFDNC